MFGLSTALRYFLHLFEALYQQWEFKELPRLTEASLAVGPYLWIGVMALAIESFRRIRTRDPVAALSWCLLAALVFMAIFSLMVFALYLPLLIVQVTLSK